MSASRRYRISSKAKADLESIWLYSFENWSREQADTYYLKIASTFAELAAGLKTGRPSTVRHGYLKCAVGAHVIYFRIHAERIDIIRILHNGMDANRHL